MRDLSAELERELAEAQDRIDDLTATGIHSCGDDCKRPNCVLRRELAEARESESSEARWAEQYKQQRDALADALRALKELGPPSKAKDIITTALATLEGRAE